MKRIIFLFLFTGWCFLLSAQTAGDALRYSYFDVEGTARTIGVGGGIGALGGDFSVLSTNPAGLAIYRTQEFVITPGFIFNNTTSALEGDASEPFTVSETKFNLNNVGLILNKRPSSAKWKSLNFGFGLNRLADFKQSFFYRGKTTGSYADRFLERAYDESGNGIFPDDLDAFEAGPAFTTGAIFEDFSNQDTTIIEYINDFQTHRQITGQNPAIQKQQSVRRKGGINEMVFSIAGNYNEKLMLGATIGVPFVSFEETRSYEEEDNADEIFGFVDMTYDERVKTSGVGVNLKLGTIYRINQMVRIGAAVHTPTAYTLTDTFMTELEYAFDEGFGVNRIKDRSPDGAFKYKLKTPWRYIGSVGVIIKKKGFITAEVEFVNYSNPSFNLTSNSDNPADEEYQGEVNGDINNLYSSAVNFKIGGEYAYQKVRIRAGYGMYGSPYSSGNFSSNSINFGLGYRLQSFYVDLAYKYTKFEEEYIPYYVSDRTLQQTVNNTLNVNNILLTVGFKF
jgi:hypothetical protein